MEKKEKKKKKKQKMKQEKNTSAPLRSVATFQTHSYGKNCIQLGLHLPYVMINTEQTGNGLVSGGTPAPALAPHDKQLLVSAPKKTALRDVQNENMATHKQQDLLPLGGKSSGDTIKAYSGMNENVMNARRRFELELGRGRLQNNVDKISDYSEPKNLIPLRQETNVTAVKALPSGGPSSVPSSFGKQSSNNNNSSAVGKVSSIDLKSNGDQIRTDRFIRLQKFLKQCDEANQREYTQMLLRLSPSDLSKHAVELEKRAIQLTVEEGSEMRRMKTLNILGKSSPTNNLMKPTQLLQSNKR
ncbi:hypothetical protein MIMGU_mgv1a010636mg [Erythranthe guttata]|uniref:Uncharacterized protein n=1 Tax=Erythranthe guttata TaxID=4155 RepID=A0A022RCD3_ERYGU|nr:hypothetical protein MIMGU_mgv1a010636mg [Erythranthe guttata]